MSISASDLRRALDFIGEAHGATDLTELRAFLPGALHGLVRTDYASYNEIDGNGGVRAALVSPEMAPELRSEWGRLAHQNPLVARFARTRDGRAYRFSDVIAREDLERLELYIRLYAPLGLSNQIAFTLPSPAALTIGIALSRGGRDYSDRDRDLLNLVRPHLIQVYRTAQERERAARLLAALERGIDAEHTALVVIERRLVAFASDGARRWLRAFGWREGRPAPAELLEMPAGARAWEPLLLAPKGQAVLIRRLQRSTGDGQTLLFEAPHAGLAPATLRGLGLTAREAAVLDRFAAGASTEQIAAQLQISHRTVYKHTQRIHAKLGSRDRAQAIATALAAERAADRPA